MATFLGNFRKFWANFLFQYLVSLLGGPTNVESILDNCGTGSFITKSNI